LNIISQLEVWELVFLRKAGIFTWQEAYVYTYWVSGSSSYEIIATCFAFLEPCYNTNSTYCHKLFPYPASSNFLFLKHSVYVKVIVSLCSP